MTEATLPITDPAEVLALFGPRDQNVRTLRQLFDVRITHRDGRIRVAGDRQGVTEATRVLERLRRMAQRKGEVSVDDVQRIVAEQTAPPIASPGAPADRPAAEVDIRHAGRRIKPRSPGQAAYVDAIHDHDLTFCIGPAGTGKTYLAVATAVEALKAQQVRKIVLVRPAIEAGENLGFLPGDLRAKLNPYLRPLLDALNEMVDFDQSRKLMEDEIIEVIPLAYMRGRTLNDAFIILDEAQNTTTAQMKMFLTRLGERSRMVVSGDISQMDLPRGVYSGLRDALHRLSSIESIGFVRLQRADIVRHPLVQNIVDAYEASQD